MPLVRSAQCAWAFKFSIRPFCHNSAIMCDRPKLDIINMCIRAGLWLMHMHYRSDFVFAMKSLIVIIDFWNFSIIVTDYNRQSSSNMQKIHPQNQVLRLINPYQVLIVTNIKFDLIHKLWINSKHGDKRNLLHIAYVPTGRKSDSS